MNFPPNSNLIVRVDADGNTLQDVLTISGVDGVSVSSSGTAYEISGNSASLSGSLISYIDSQDAALSGALTNEYQAADLALSGVLQTDIDSRVLRAGDTMTGFLTLDADPTASGHAATKQYVDAQLAAATVGVKDDNVLAVASANFLDFGHALAVTSGGTEADIDVDESEFTTVVKLTGDQVISGNKTFADNVIVNGDLVVEGTTTTLNTETLLVEDNIIELNSNFTGDPGVSGVDGGIYIARGDEDSASLIWDETNDYWVAGLSGTEERILLESDLSTINGNIATLSGLIDQNASDIADNASDITVISGLTVQNASDIADNAADITTLSGLIDQNTSDITDNAADIASLSGYVDATFVEITGDTMTGFLTLNADPTNPLHAATKQYVDDRDIALSGALAGEYEAADLALSGALVTYINNQDIALSGAITNAYEAADLALSGALTNAYEAADLALSGALQDDFVNVTGDTMTGSLEITNGEFSVKSHAAYSGSEYVETTSAVQTFDNTEINVQTLTLEDDSVYWIESIVVGRKASGGTFRTRMEMNDCLVYRQSGGGATLVSAVRNTLTRSLAAGGYGVKIDVSGNDLRVRVDGATGETVNWVSTLRYQKVGTNV